MGNCITGAGDASAKNRNKDINKGLKNSKLAMAKEVKLLLLGAGESGKSTIFKQMKIIHHDGYTHEERMLYREIIYTNTLQSMKTLVNMAEQFQYPIEDKERAARIGKLENDDIYIHVKRVFTPELGQDIAELWKDKAIQETFARRSEFQLLDSADYYFNNMERISKTDYVPSEADVLRSRVKTTGIVETEFQFGGFTFKLFDVGGQRNERNKWIHCFQGVTAVIFVASLSEYDQKCYEDDSTNRLEESLHLFDEIANSKWFVDTSIILFLNKVDLFTQKLKFSPMKNVFPDFEGDNTYEAASKFIQEKFLRLNKNESKPIYVHYTEATDTNSIKNVFVSIKDIIINNNLGSTI